MLIIVNGSLVTHNERNGLSFSEECSSWHKFSLVLDSKKWSIVVHNKTWRYILLHRRNDWIKIRFKRAFEEVKLWVFSVSSITFMAFSSFMIFQNLLSHKVYSKFYDQPNRKFHHGMIKLSLAFSKQRTTCNEQTIFLWGRNRNLYLVGPFRLVRSCKHLK